LRQGRWAAAEGLVYEDWDRSVHLIDPFPIPDDWQVIASVDWGFTNPGVIQVWALDGDGRMYRVCEVYQTRRTITWWAGTAARLGREHGVEVFVCDPSEPSFIQELVNAGLQARQANNEVARGIQAVQDRIKRAGDGRPRLFLFRDALTERDEVLAEAKKPTCTEEEIDAYVWPKDVGGKAVKEQPVKLDDHGCDAMRYAAMHLAAPRFRMEWV